MNPPRRVGQSKRAFDHASDKYGAPRLLDETDADFYREDKAGRRHLAELVKRLPERKITGREAVEAVDACFASGIVADCCARPRRRPRDVVVVQGLARRSTHAKGAVRGLDRRGIERFNGRRRSSGPARGARKGAATCTSSS